MGRAKRGAAVRPGVTILALALAGVAIAGCSPGPGGGLGDGSQRDGAAPPGDAGPARDAREDAAHDAAMPADGSTSVPETDAGPRSEGACPSAPAAPGTPCSRDFAVCTWGEDPFYGCRDAAYCSGGRFTTIPELDTCIETPPIECPPEPIAGSACAEEWSACRSGERDCVCVPCLGRDCASGGRSEMVCTNPLADPACPRRGPNLGRACSVDGQRCTYGHCDIGNIFVVECDEGIWKRYPGAVSCL